MYSKSVTITQLSQAGDFYFVLQNLLVLIRQKRKITYFLAVNLLFRIFFSRYGYRGRDCRNNLYVLSSGELIYFTAAVVVLYDVASHKQRHYTEHTDDIKR